MQKFFRAVRAAGVRYVPRALDGHVVQFLFRAFADRDFRHRMNDDKGTFSFEQAFHVRTVCDISEYERGFLFFEYLFRFLVTAGKPNDAAILRKQFFRQNVAHITCAARYDIRDAAINISIASPFMPQVRVRARVRAFSERRRYRLLSAPTPRNPGIRTS